MFDTATCTAVLDQWAEMQRTAESRGGGFGDLADQSGPDLAADLGYWEPETRSDEELIDRIGAWEKLRARADAGQLGEIAELVARRRAADQLERADHAARGGQGEPAQLMEFVVDEIALAARTSRVSASTPLDLAQQLTGCLPEVYAALACGAIDLGRARLITDATRPLDPDLRVEVSQQVLARAAAQTPSTLRAALARAIAIADPGGVEERHTADHTRRRATLHRLAQAGHTPADRKPGDHRTADQRRADALIDLATSYLDTHPGLTPTPAEALARASRTDNPAAGRPAASGAPTNCGAETTSTGPTPTPERRRSRTRRPPAWAQVQVVLPANLLTGNGPEPAELLGYGPIPTTLALSLAADATWQRLLTDPATGALLDVGTTRYTPPAPIAAYAITRDRSCRFPSCRQPRIDLDHPTPYPADPPPTTTSPASAATTTAETTPPLASHPAPRHHHDLDHPHRHHQPTPTRRTRRPTTVLSGSRRRISRGGERQGLVRMTSRWVDRVIAT